MFERRQFGTSRRRVLFFVGGYRTSIAVYKPLYWIARLLGYRVYAYVLDAQTVISSNIMAYVGQIEAIQQDIAKTLKSLPDEIPAYVMGNSLGSESALYALKYTPELRAAALITARGSIAEFIWKTSAGKVFKPTYVENNYDFTQISQELSPAEPTKDLHLIGDRPVYVYYSSVDKVIPESNTQLLVKKFKEEHITYKIKRYSRGGHFATTVKGLGAFWRWHDFFQDPKK